jgi:thioredoxin 1
MGTPVTITTSTFEHDVLHAPGPVLIDFWAPWCGPCRLIGPVVEEIATQYAGRLTVGKLTVDEHPAVARRYGITGIPALVFVHEGQVRETVVGAVPQRVLMARVDEVRRRAQPPANVAGAHAPWPRGAWCPGGAGRLLRCARVWPATCPVSCAPALRASLRCVSPRHRGRGRR